MHGVRFPQLGRFATQIPSRFAINNPRLVLSFPGRRQASATTFPLRGRGIDTRSRSSSSSCPRGACCACRNSVFGPRLINKLSISGKVARRSAGNPRVKIMAAAPDTAVEKAIMDEDGLDGSNEEGAEPSAATSKTQRKPVPKTRNTFENGPRISVVDPNETILDASDYDIVCDVRSPAEYEEDHLIGAISTPVLDNEQRAQVGTLYKSNPFNAKKLGAGLIAGNLGKILLEHFQDKDKSTRVLVYCWRGGERSLSLSHVLCRIGFNVSFLHGGYRGYRNQVREALEECGTKYKFCVISGRTGSAKGKLLDAITAAGGQVVDLEVCADHRGSILGQEPSTNFTQPSQKMFESRLFASMCKFDPSKPVFVEGESSRIGIRHVPKSMWAAMKTAKQFELMVPTECRVRWTRSQYQHYETTHIDKLKTEMRTLGRLHPEGNKIADKWIAMADAGNWDGLVEDLLVNHYDLAYARAWLRNYGDNEAKPSVIRVPDCSDDTFADVAHQLVTTGNFVGSIPESECEGGVSTQLADDLPDRIYIEK